VHQFFNKHLLHWIEALSLIGATGEGIVIAFVKLKELMKVSLREALQPNCHN
jgi:hypothetical protein